MNLVACPKCGARFDVSTLPPGSTFICGQCKNMLQVPRSAAAPPPVFPPPRGAPGRPAPPPWTTPGRAGSGTTQQMPAMMDPRRAGAGVAPPPVAPPPGRAGRRERRGAERDSGRKNNMPLVLGGAGLVVVAIIVVIAVSMGGKKGPATVPGPGPVGGARGAGGGTPVPPRPVDRAADLQKRYIGAGDNMTSLEAVYREAKAAGLSDLCRKIADHAITVDQNSQWANEGLGRKNLEPLFAKVPEDQVLDENPIDEFEKLRFLKEDTEESRWATPERYAEIEKMVQKVVEHLNKLKTDVGYADVSGVMTRVSKDPILKDYEYKVEDNLPYVVFVETKGRTDLAAQQEAEKLVKRNTELLKYLYDQVFEKFGKLYDLIPLKQQKGGDMRTLKVFTFFDEESFQQYQQKINEPVPPGVRAYYSPSTTWIILFEGRGGEDRASGQSSSFNVNKTIHEGFHQLMHSLTKACVERELKESVPWTDSRLHSKLHWFQEGMAELVGSSRPKPDGGVEIMVPYKQRIDEWKMTRASKWSEWSLEEILDISSQMDMRQKAAKKGLADADRLASLFYAEAWAWCHFLYYFEDGKYRQKLLDYMGQELKGNSGPEVFKQQIWGKAPGDKDWSAVKKEFESHVQKLFKEN